MYYSLMTANTKLNRQAVDQFLFYHHQSLQRVVREHHRICLRNWGIYYEGNAYGKLPEYGRYGGPVKFSWTDRAERYFEPYE